MASQSERRLALLTALQATAKEYTAAERKRLENEVKVLKAVLSGRTGGAGIQKLNTKVAAAVAQRSLAAYLNPTK